MIELGLMLICPTIILLNTMLVFKQLEKWFKDSFYTKLKERYFSIGILLLGILVTMFQYGILAIIAGLIQFFK